MRPVKCSNLLEKDLVAKIDEFKSIADVELFAKGRGARHMCIYNNLRKRI